MAALVARGLQQEKELACCLAGRSSNTVEQTGFRARERRLVAMNRFRCMILVVGILALGGGEAMGADNGINFDLTNDFFSKYIWRGQNVDDKSVLQPTLSARAYGFTGSIWGNIDLTDRSQTAPDNAWEFSEFDYTLDYTATVPGADWLNFSVGAIYYRFPNTVFAPTTEIYGGLSLNGAPLSPSFKWYRDVAEIKGSYFQFGLGHTFEKIKEWSEKCYCGLQLGASIGWANSAYNRGYFGVNGSGGNDLTLTAGLPFCIDSWTIKPSVNYSTMLSDSIRSATGRSDNFWVGVGIFTSF